MTQEEMKQKIDSLMSDASFAQRVSECETYDDLANIFSAEGLTVSPEELEAAMDKVTASGASDELNEDDLESVAGGFISGSAFLAWSICYAVVVIGHAVSYAKSKKKTSKK